MFKKKNEIIKDHVFYNVTTNKPFSFTKCINLLSFKIADSENEIRKTLVSNSDLKYVTIN